MADYTDEDPLSDYNPGGQPSTSEPDTEAASDSTILTASDPDLPPPTDEALFPPFDSPADDVSFPIEEYGRYEDNYPESAAQLRASRARRDQDTQQNSDDDVTGTAEVVLNTLRNCYAAMEGRTAAELIDLIGYTMTSKEALEFLSAGVRKVYDRIAEVLISEYSDDRSRIVDLNDLPGEMAVNGKVKAELALIRIRIGRDELPAVPSSAWKALVNWVQRMASRTSALGLSEAIAAGATDEDCMKLFRSLVPPTSSTALQNGDFSRTVQEWEAADLAAAAEMLPYRISSGYPTLDYAFTQKDKFGKDSEPRGAWGPGELHVFAAPTGNGKSAANRILLRAAAEDLVTGWQMKHAMVLAAITEETPKIVYTVAGMAKGQPFHHLADNVKIANVGASRRRLVHSVWDCVIAAYHRSQETGMPIVNCGMPAMIFVDYYGALADPGESEVQATEKTANLMMRGFCAWDVMAMEDFSGESFAGYAGMSWPAGMENFRPVVLAFAQFVKLPLPWNYDPDANMNLDDFQIPRADGTPGWEVLPGDFRLPSQSQIRGSGVLANHATSIIIGHRSRVVGNDRNVDPVTGEMHLDDDRARWLLPKTRNGSNLPFIEMRFDSIPSGLRGQFFDRRAEKAMDLGKLAPTECYREVGDPILPHRPRRSVFAGISY